MARRLILLAMCAIALSACRLDVTVDVAMAPDGTGVVTLVATADEELVARVPDLVGDLRLDDAIANGWVVDGPTGAEGGGLAITLTHAFSTPDELANVLNSIGPPLTRMAAARTTDPSTEQTTNAINGELVLADGFAAFADAELIAAVGALPFEEEIVTSGLTPSEAMSFTFRVGLPGELISAETGTEVGDDVIEWQAPLDGTTVNLYTATVQRPAGAGSSWAGPVSTIALVALIVWSVVATAFIAFVVVARRAKRTRRERALRRLDRAPAAPPAADRDDEAVR